METRFILKIIDVLNIAGRRIYQLKKETENVYFGVNDILYDKENCRFQVIAIELINVRWSSDDWSDYPLFLRLKPLDEENIHGETLSNLPRMTKQEICDFIIADKEFRIDGKQCAIYPFEDIIIMTNGIDEFGFDTLEKAVEAPIFDDNSVIDLWDIIYPQIV